MPLLPYLRIACVLVLSICAVGVEESRKDPEEDVTCLLQYSRQEHRTPGTQSLLEHLNSFGLGSGLWSGMDETIDGSGLSLLGTSSPSSHAKLNHFEIMGLYNTGTNLLHHLLLSNFGSQLSMEATDATPPKKGCLFWKHSSLSILKLKSPNTLQGCNGSVVGLAMIRNPLAWLHSMHRQAYDLNNCAQRENWLKIPCRYPRGTPQHTLAGETFPNLQTIYTKWTQDYESLASFGFNRSLLIRYEDLVMDTEGVLSQIASLANLSLPDDGIVQFQQAVHPTAVKANKNNEREVAIAQIQTKSYLELFKGSALATACAYLDRDVMHRHGYTDCDAVM
mmetsp:Transcript_149191/g.387958  ORF Transcript_149191/g.387958 Transcript_149191/m.387958 type:complete len:336 (-) Transcript_149191:59-1066(-)